MPVPPGQGLLQLLVLALLGLTLQQGRGKIWGRQSSRQPRGGIEGNNSFFQRGGSECTKSPLAQVHGKGQQSIRK